MAPKNKDLRAQAAPVSATSALEESPVPSEDTTAPAADVKKPGAKPPEGIVSTDKDSILS